MGHSNDVVCVSFSVDGNNIVSGSRDKTVKIWDRISMKNLQNLEGHSD